MIASTKARYSSKSSSVCSLRVRAERTSWIQAASVSLETCAEVLESRCAAVDFSDSLRTFASAASTVRVHESARGRAGRVHAPADGFASASEGALEA